MGHPPSSPLQKVAADPALEVGPPGHTLDKTLICRYRQGKERGSRRIVRREVFVFFFFFDLVSTGGLDEAKNKQSIVVVQVTY